MTPQVTNYGDFNQEKFESYYAKFPNYLKNIPKDVVENWIYRHYDDFIEWIPLNPQNWIYELKDFTNEDILTISHILDWMPELKAEGLEYVSGGKRANHYVGKYMLSHGTTPSPIIVGENIGHLYHPNQKSILMKNPYQLIEGHKRLACLLGMINISHHNLNDKHKVWVINIK